MRSRYRMGAPPPQFPLPEQCLAWGKENLPSCTPAVLNPCSSKTSCSWPSPACSPPSCWSAACSTQWRHRSLEPPRSPRPQPLPMPTASPPLAPPAGTPAPGGTSRGGSGRSRRRPPPPAAAEAAAAPLARRRAVAARASCQWSWRRRVRRRALLRRRRRRPCWGDIPSPPSTPPPPTRQQQQLLLLLPCRLRCCSMERTPPREAGGRRCTRSTNSSSTTTSSSSTNTRLTNSSSTRSSISRLVTLGYLWAWRHRSHCWCVTVLTLEVPSNPVALRNCYMGVASNCHVWWARNCHMWLARFVGNDWPRWINHLMSSEHGPGAWLLAWPCFFGLALIILYPLFVHAGSRRRLVICPMRLHVASRGLLPAVNTQRRSAQ